MLCLSFVMADCIPLRWLLKTTTIPNKRVENLLIRKFLYSCNLFAGEVTKYSIEIGRKAAPTTKMIWYPFVIYVKSSTAYSILKQFLHTIPGYFYDILAILFGREERYNKI